MKFHFSFLHLVLVILQCDALILKFAIVYYFINKIMWVIISFLTGQIQPRHWFDAAAIFSFLFSLTLIDFYTCDRQVALSLNMTKEDISNKTNVAMLRLARDITMLVLLDMSSLSFYWIIYTMVYTKKYQFKTWKSFINTSGISKRQRILLV